MGWAYSSATCLHVSAGFIDHRGLDVIGVDQSLQGVIFKLVDPVFLGARHSCRALVECENGVSHLVF